MYVKCEKDTLVSICLPEMEDSAEFSDNNIAQVTEQDGTVLVETYPDEFSEHNNE